MGPSWFPVLLLVLAVGVTGIRACTDSGTTPCGPGCCSVGNCTLGGFCEGACLSPSVACRNTATGDLQCVMLSVDAANCGGCNQRCGAGTCLNGQCACPARYPTMCNLGLNRPYCADLLHDPANCGSCNSRCLPGGNCTAGVCATPNGLEFCPSPSGTGGAYVDVRTDPANCAVCGRQCFQSVCVNGRCVDGKLNELILEEQVTTNHESTTIAWGVFGAFTGAAFVLAFVLFVVWLVWDRCAPSSPSYSSVRRASSSELT